MKEPSLQTDKSTAHSLPKAPPSHAVRLQGYVDADLHAANGHSEIFNKIKNAQKELAQAAGAESSNVNRTAIAELYSRFWIEGSALKKSEVGTSNDTQNSNNDSKSTFTVAQFNTLAKGLSSGPSDIFPTPFEKADSVRDGDYGGFTSLPNPKAALDFDRIRKWRLLHVMLGGGVSDDVDAKTADCDLKPAFDILALEEVDEYNSFFHPALVKDGSLHNQSSPSSTNEDVHHINCYQGVYQPKPQSPCIPLGWYSDGVALLWNPEKFQTIARESSVEPWIEKDSFNGRTSWLGNKVSNQVYVIVPLQLKGTDKCIVVAATHLKAKKGRVNEQIRKIQALQLRQRAEQMAAEVMNEGWNNTSILILGDFNSEITDASVRSILSQGESNSTADPWKFKSAYPLDGGYLQGVTDLYTTWKTRKDGAVRRVIDYIFHASRQSENAEVDALQCTHTLSIPENEEVEQSFFPGFRYPSDHLLIAAKFQY